MDISLILIFLVGVVLGGIVVWFFWRKNSAKQTGTESPVPTFKNNDRSKNFSEFNKTRSQKRELNKQKILDFLNQNSKVTNNDVEKLISVSDATATRYLDELEKEGKIKQTAEEGRGVYYQKL